MRPDLRVLLGLCVLMRTRTCWGQVPPNQPLDTRIWSPWHSIFAGIVGIVLVSLAAPARAQLTPNAFVCAQDSFVLMRNAGGPVPPSSMKIFTYPLAGGGPVTGPSVTATAGSTNVNAFAAHPITGEVHAWDVVAFPLSASARRLNTDGSLVDISATVPVTGLTNAPLAGATFDAVGNWLVATEMGDAFVVDLVPGSPTYGTVTATGLMALPIGGYMSGDMAYRASDDRIYFVAFATDAFPATAAQVYSISRSAFIAGGTLTPVAGPMLNVGNGGLVSGSALGIDSAGNLWFSTRLSNSTAQTYVFAAADLTQSSATTISPISTYAAPSGSSGDGFFCRAGSSGTNAGQITVSKGLAAGSPAGTSTGPFNVYATCNLPAANTRYPSSGFVSVTTAVAGVITGIPANASCTISEDTASLPAPPAGFTWGAPSVTQPVGTVPAGGNLTASILNSPQAVMTPVPVPVNSPWMLGLLAAMLGGLVWLGRRFK